MPRKKRYARIAITLPAEELASADRIARDRDRPRSWVIAEAVRQYAAGLATAPSSPPPASITGLGDSRRAQLRADLRLSPEARVRAAEETARVSLLLRPPVRQVIAFDRYEDYLAWKRLQELGGA